MVLMRLIEADKRLAERNQKKEGSFQIQLISDSGSFKPDEFSDNGYWNNNQQKVYDCMNHTKGFVFGIA